MIIKAASLTKKIILATFFSTLLLLLLGYTLLIEGIEIKRLSFPSLIIEKLYLKLDKKLIVESKKLIIVSKKDRPLNYSFFINAIEYIPQFFQKIFIENFQIQNKNISILYQNKKFTLRNRDLLLIASLIKNNNRILATIHHGKYKPFNISLYGKGTITKEFLQFNGKYTFEGIEGNFKLQNIKQRYLLYLNSKNFSNNKLKKAFSHFHLHHEIKKWSYKNVVAKRYRLNYINIKFDPKKGFKAKDLEALATAYNVKVHFQPSLPPANVKKVLIHFANDTLNFKLIKPTYQNKNLHGSYVTIKNLTKPKKSYIKIVIKTVSKFDKSVANLLQAYKLTIPIKHMQGNIDAKVTITIPLISKKIDISGKFLILNTKILLQDVPITLPQSHLRLLNKKIILKDTSATFFDIFHTHLKGFIDFQKKQGKFFVRIDKAKLERDGFILFNINNVSEYIYIDLSKKRLFAKHFNIEATFDKTKSIHIYDLNTLLPYSSFLQKFAPFKANLHINLQKSGITFVSNLFKKNELFFYHNKPISKFNIKGHLLASKAILKINDFITATIAKEIDITCRNLACKFPKESNSSFIQKPIKITLYNTTLFYKDIPIPFEAAHIQIDSTKMALKGRYNQREIIFNKDDTNFSLKAKDLDADFVNRVFNKPIFQGGDFIFSAKGDIKRFHAISRFKHTYIKNLKALNNIFAFINSIPALITFNNPGFNTKGLFVKKGTIEFDYNNGFITIKKLFLESHSLNFVGSGTLNLNSKQLNMHIKLITFKSITNILNKIPIAGYILLGKDGNAYTTLHLTGDIEDPKVTTQLTKETLQLPLNIIKRTLQLPFKLFK